MLFGAQLIGGIIASALVLGLTPAGSGGVDVVNTTVSDQISYQQAFVLEFLGTSFLVFSVLMLAVEKVCLGVRLSMDKANGWWSSIVQLILHLSASG